MPLTLDLPQAFIEPKDDTVLCLQENEDATFEFKLFSAPKPAGEKPEVTPNSLTHVRLVDDPGKAGDGTITSARPLSYYFSSPSNAEARKQFEISSVDGQEILRRAQKGCPGLRYPWKVIHLHGAQDASGVLTTSDPVTLATPASKQRKSRKGKKARIKIRTKIRAEESRRRAQQEVIEQNLIQSMEKEQHLRAKKSATNRRKQLKKREKQRQAKEVNET